jgi:hypothetical protein
VIVSKARSLPQNLPPQPVQANGPAWAGTWSLNFNKTTGMDFSGQLLQIPFQSVTMKLEPQVDGVKITWDFVGVPIHNAAHVEVTFPFDKTTQPPDMMQGILKDLLLRKLNDYALEVSANPGPAAPVTGPQTIRIVASPDGKTLTMVNSATASVASYDRQS